MPGLQKKETNHRHIAFSVMSLNLRFGLADDGPNSWRHRKRAYPTLLSKYNTDFIGFQEANDFQVKYIGKILNNYDFIGKRSPAPPFWQNNVIFYKKDWTCTYFDHFYLSPTPLIPSRSRASVWPRQCTIGRFMNDTRTLVCINTHFDFDASVQVESAKLIMHRLSCLPPEHPAILMGDFNATPDDPCFTVFTESGHPTTEKGVYFKNVFSGDLPGTHHDFTGEAEGNHIDWLLYRGGIIKRGSAVIKDRINGIYPSDHFPVYASFDWEK